MKNFRKLATLALSLVIAFSFGAFTACGGGDDSFSSSSQTEAATAYKFKVLNADTTPAVGFAVQLCQDDACFAPKFADSEGLVTYAFPNNQAGEYSVHVWSSDMETEYTFEGTATTSLDYDGSVITLTING